MRDSSEYLELSTPYVMPAQFTRILTHYRRSHQQIGGLTLTKVTGYFIIVSEIKRRCNLREITWKQGTHLGNKRWSVRPYISGKLKLLFATS